MIAHKLDGTVAPLTRGSTIGVCLVGQPIDIGAENMRESLVRSNLFDNFVDVLDCPHTFSSATVPRAGEARRPGGGDV